MNEPKNEIERLWEQEKEEIKTYACAAYKKAVLLLLMSIRNKLNKYIVYLREKWGIKIELQIEAEK